MDQSIVLTQYLKRVAVVIGLVFLTYLGYVLYLNTTFRIVGTDPTSGGFATISPFLKVTFSKELAAQNLTVKGTVGLIDSSSVNKKVVTILLNTPLNADKPYYIELDNIRSASGKQLPNWVFHFTPHDLSEDRLSADQQKALAASQVQYNQVIQNDKLIQLLPFTSGGNEYRVDYTVEYSHQKAHPVIIITAPTEQGQQDAINWIQQLGINPASYTITYKTAPVQ